MKLLLVFVVALATSVAAYNTRVEPVTLLDLAGPFGESKNLEGRITNGQAAAADQFPYQVGLSLRKSSTSTSWCGGSLIAPTWVLTAAHCTTGAQSVTVYLGSTERSAPKATRTVDADQIIQHANYIASTLSNDISLIKIPAVPLSSSIQIVKLPAISSYYATYATEYAIISGWGRTSDTSTVSAYLNYARSQIITNSNCAAVYGTAVVTSNTICISTPQGVSTCQGDSGGPLVLESSGLLVGVTSFVASAGCAAGFPSGFVRTTSYLDWIKTNSGVSY